MGSLKKFVCCTYLYVFMGKGFLITARDTFIFLFMSVDDDKSTRCVVGS